MIGVHNLFSNPGFVGNIKQDLSSLSITTEQPTTGSDVRKATQNLTANNYAAQCYTGTSQTSQYTNKADCIVDTNRAWRAGAYGTLTVNKFDEKLSIGDELVFASSVTAGNYVSSKRTIFTLTVAKAASSGAQTLTGTFNGPIANNDIIVSHRRYVPAFMEYPSAPVVDKDKIISMTCITNITAQHDYYGGGFEYRWIQTDKITGPDGVNPGDIGGDLGDSHNNFKYPNNLSLPITADSDLRRKPRVFYATSSKNGFSRGSEDGLDYVNVIPSGDATMSTLEIGPFGSLFTKQGGDNDTPSKRGSYFWCEVVLYELKNSNYYIRKVIQSPPWFLEVTGF